MKWAESQEREGAGWLGWLMVLSAALYLAAALAAGLYFLGMR